MWPTQKKGVLPLTCKTKQWSCEISDIDRCLISSCTWYQFVPDIDSCLISTSAWSHCVWYRLVPISTRAWCRLVSDIDWSYCNINTRLISTCLISTRAWYQCVWYQHALDINMCWYRLVLDINTHLISTRAWYQQVFGIGSCLILTCVRYRPLPDFDTCPKSNFIHRVQNTYLL